MNFNPLMPGIGDLHHDQGFTFVLSSELKKAVEFQQAGQIAAAERLCLSIIERHPKQPDALNLLGVIAYQKDANGEAENLISTAIQNAPGNPYYHNNLGAVFKAKGKISEAVGCYKKAVQLKSDYYEAYCNLGRTFYVQKKYRQAVDSYKSSIQLNPSYFEAYFHLGIAFQEQGHFEKAIRCYQRTIELKPDFAKPYYTMGVIYHDQGAFEKAILYYQKTIDLKPDFFEAHNGIGLAWQSLKKFGEALSCLQTAIDLVPDSDAVYVNIGTVYQEQNRYNKALNCYRKALGINKRNAIAHLNLGTCLMGIGKSLEAADCYRRALDLNPNYAKACAYLVGQLQQECAWQELMLWTPKLDDSTKRALIKKEKPAETPFLNITRHADPALNYAVAKMWCGNDTRSVSNSQRGFAFTKRLIGDRKITIGYLSNNFRNHPTAHLVHDLFDLHDRDRFNVYCYSYGKNDGSSFRVKIERNSDCFVELRNISNVKSAEKIFDDNVDILVDLAGHTEGNRMEICSLRPAPLQVRYLGMPGTTGADYFDYIVTDSIVIPEEHAPFYSEEFVYLPHCYQMNSTRPGFSDYGFTRANLGLPENGFVFCSFNTNYKIDPVIFDVWMSILKRVSGSVLWLLKGKETVERNLRQEAAIRDVDPNRLVFGDKLPTSENLSRLRYADLALDTGIVNGAMTTSDALWTGVPVVTSQGTHFASRMSSSILSAIGLPEMVANSLEQYESLAVELADDTRQLERLKEKLENNRKTEPLFDTSQFVKHLEKAYAEILKIFLAGAKPRQIKVTN